MDTSVPDQPKSRRPKAIWVITIFYSFSAAWTLLSFGLIYGGIISLPPEQALYFERQNLFDKFVTIVMAAVNLTAVVYLFRMKRQALYLFGASFGGGVLMTIYHTVAKGWLDALGTSGLIGAFIGWSIIVAVIAYCYRGVKQGVLR